MISQSHPFFKLATTVKHLKRIYKQDIQTENTTHYTLISFVLLQSPVFTNQSQSAIQIALFSSSDTTTEVSMHNIQTSSLTVPKIKIYTD